MRQDGSGNSPLISDRSHHLPRCACLLARSASPIRAQLVFIKKTPYQGEVETKTDSTCHRSSIDVVTDMQISAGGK